ncbi:uncharacterized protein B0T15DRAFT_549305 [Chaetomium strumarium]|uniref:Uncharacterized protein n=1 Tax=Chaetomium strumarium TaxID=1170767 RepID=A0AAJ0M7D8_9PEZI|nr:hypothetical protein B0T15DRAFT_549305 [Chaetomium strumarium]
MATCAEFEFQKCGFERGVVKANPDIAGIGIILSFLVTTSVTVLAGFYRILFDFITEFFLTPYQQDIVRFPSGDGWLWVNPGFWARVVDRLLLALNDSQLFTGTAVQVASLVQHCEITIYHLRIVAELAFLSTVTHLLTVVAMSGYFIDNAGSNTPRVLVMLLNLGLLGYTTWFAYLYEAASPFDESLQLGCYYAGYRPPVVASFTVRWTLLLLAAVLGHLVVFLAMYWKGFRTWIAGTRGAALRFFRTAILVPAYTIYGLVSSSRVLRQTQALGTPPVDIEGSEREWGFGQILALLLLALIVLPGWDSFME